VTITIGRLTLPDPSTYEPGTQQVTVGGVLSTADDPLSPAQAVFVAEQLAAMASPGSEEVVPVVCEVFSGFYRVVSVNVAAFDGVRYAQGYGEWEVTLEPVLGRGLPVVESMVRGAERVNAFTLDPLPFHAVPGSVIGYQPITPRTNHNGVKEHRDVEGGTALWSNVFDFGGDGIVYSGDAQWQVDPSDWYEAACYVDDLVDAEHFTHVASGQVLDPAGSWYLGNGMVRFSAAGEALRFSWYEGDWSTPLEFEVDNAVPETTTWVAARVVYVGPERCTVRIVGTNGNPDYPLTSSSRVYVNVTVRRGSPWVDLHITFQGQAQPNQIRAATAAAVSDETWGMLRTAGDWRWAVAATVANTVTTGSGIIYPTGADFFRSVGIGARHSTWTGARAAGEFHKEWFAAQNERTVIGRQL
jgi:hypothetical protein